MMGSRRGKPPFVSDAVDEANSSDLISGLAWTELLTETSSIRYPISFIFADISETFDRDADVQ